MTDDDIPGNFSRSRRFALATLPVVALAAAGCSKTQSPEEISKEVGPPPRPSTTGPSSSPMPTPGTAEIRTCAI